VDVFGRRTAFVTRGRPWTRGVLKFACLNKPAMATLFHVNSSLAAGHNWRRPRRSKTAPSIHDTNSTSSPDLYNYAVSDAFDPNEMVLRFRERADAVKRRGLPPVEGPERLRFLEAAKLDFQDFAMLGDATATLQDGILRFEIDLRPGEKD
jgi:hypothetical protein